MHGCSLCLEYRLCGLSSSEWEGATEVKAKSAASKAAGLTAALVCLVIAGCGGGDQGSDTARGEGVRVGYVVDTAGVEDGGFNQLGAEGLARAGEEFGVETEVIASASESDYAEDVAALADDGYDLVIVAGFNLVEAVSAASRDYPETDFAIVDIPYDELPGAGENVRGLPFDQEPAGLLAGYLAGLMVIETEGEGATVGAIGGQRIPPVASWISGFETGLAEVSPSLELIKSYAGSFIEPERCRKIAREQIAAGAVLIFEAAARCGVAAIEMVGRDDVYAIGTDGDYLDLGDHVLASGLKRTDIAVFETVEDLLDGNFRGGEDRLFTIADGGVGLSELGQAVPPDIHEKVERRAGELAAGDLN